MRAGLRAGLFGVGAFALVALLPATAAGAATAVGRVTVSNPTPTRTSSINVTSTGWRPGSVVSITLSTTKGLLGHATADSAGAIHAAISIPAEAPVGFGVLSVNGSTPGGVPQEIVTALIGRQPRTGPGSSAPLVRGESPHGDRHPVPVGERERGQTRRAPHGGPGLTCPVSRAVTSSRCAGGGSASRRAPRARRASTCPGPSRGRAARG